MTWKALEPVVGKVLHPVKMSVRARRGGHCSVLIIFSDVALREFGNPEHADVMLGEADNANEVWVGFKPEGKFALKEFAKGGASITLPHFDPAPQVTTEATPCLIRERSLTHVRFCLPNGWLGQKKPDRSKAAPPEPERPVVAPGKIDAVQYMKKKGIEIKRLPGAETTHFLQDGRRIEKADVLKAINGYRRQEQLPALGLDDIV